MMNKVMNRVGQIYSEVDFSFMHSAGELASRVLDYIEGFLEAGITTDKINDLCHSFIVKNNGIPAPLGYHGFPKSICTSINEVVCHGIPSARKLINGDIINIDVTVILDGWHGDTSRMFKIGDVSKVAEKLIDVTREAMMRGIEIVKPGISIGEIAEVIQKFSEKNGFSVVRDFCGHGIGRIFHDNPIVPHFGKKGDYAILKEGMSFTIEPMINVGKYNVKILNDGWTAVTVDGSLSSQFEHSLGVTKSGYTIFTKSRDNNQNKSES